MKTVRIPADNSRGYKIVNADDPRAQNQRITPKSIGTMRKSEVRELLEAHGAEAGGTVSQMRARLIEVMFI